MQGKLEKLLEQVEYRLVRGDLSQEVTDIAYDSRMAKKGYVFVCIEGAISDGHRYIGEVVEKGAVAVVVEKEVEVPEGVTVIRVAQARKALALMSAAYFEYPCRKLITIGITGTKGKSTVSHMIRETLEKAEEKVGIIGTIGAFINGKELETQNTTPQSYELHRLFSLMVEEGCKYMVMEVSSQGLKLDRTAGIEFDYGVFTNLSPDHIGRGEHADFDEYMNCKAMLFRQCKTGIGNADDKHFKEVFEKASCQIVTFGTSEGVDFLASHIQHMADGGDLSMAFDVSGRLSGRMVVGLPGRFNVYNALCAAAACMEMGISEETILHALERVKVRGRVEPMDVGEKFTILIDYAHNEVSARSVLTTLREYNPNRIISIFGCGGCRSKERRYTMGEAIGMLSELSVITADNPRTENVLDIIEDIKVGMRKSGGRYIAIPDRQEAVTYAIRQAQEGDMILLLGKGHEDYQEIDGVKYHYGEREAVAKAVEEIFGRHIKY